MGASKLPDLGDGGVRYLVTLTEREINAIYGAQGFLKGLGAGRPKVAADWMRHYLPTLEAASKSIERQTEKGAAMHGTGLINGPVNWGRVAQGALVGAFLLGCALVGWVIL